MLGFVAKDHDSYGFSVKKYGRQQATEMGQPTSATACFRTATGRGQRLARHVGRGAGRSSSPRACDSPSSTRDRPDAVRYWALDNEPMLWHETHRDVRPKPLGYDELWDRTVQYAEAIKQADPAAKVAGFCSWGWTDLFYSAADEGGDGYAHASPTHRDHGGMPLAEWFIQKCGEYKRTHGKSLVDVFDFHWYPQAELAGRDAVPGHWHGPEVQSASAADDSRPVGSGLPAGIVGQATPATASRRWCSAACGRGSKSTIPAWRSASASTTSAAATTSPAHWPRPTCSASWPASGPTWRSSGRDPEGTQELAWKLFRNYDGAGGRFGDRYLPAESNHADLAVYAAKRSKDGATTIVVVNKNLGGAVHAEAQRARPERARCGSGGSIRRPSGKVVEVVKDGRRK